MRFLLRPEIMKKRIKPSSLVESNNRQYNTIFSGVTLILSPDNGSDLPEFKMNRRTRPTVINTPAWAKEDCEDAIDDKLDNLRSCEAKVAILLHFVAVTGSNALATYVGGMTASSPLTYGNIGVPGVKLLTAPPPSPALLGGAESDFPVSGEKLPEEGCPTFSNHPRVRCPDLAPEAAAYNVLTVFFNGTPVARHYGGEVGVSPAPSSFWTSLTMTLSPQSRIHARPDRT